MVDFDARSLLMSNAAMLLRLQLQAWWQPGQDDG